MSALPATTTRRVLQTLDTNTRNPNSPKKSPKVLGASTDLARDMTPSKMSQNIGEAPLSGTKRAFDMDIPRLVQDGDDGKVPRHELSQQENSQEQASGVQEQKRVKVSHLSADTSTTERDSSFGNRIVFPQSKMQPRSPPRLTITASPTHSSPASTCFSSIAGMDDSQDTVLTVPDDVQTIATASFATVSSQPSVSLSRAEIRQKAKTLRLRLSLASYKLRTNQVNVPISRLQIRASSPELPRLPRPGRSNVAGKEKNLGIVRTPKKKRTPLPSSSSPFIELRKRDALVKKTSEYKENRVPSPPPRAEAGDVDGDEGLVGEAGQDREATTPILPKQRERIRNNLPRPGSPIWGDRERERDLTSSVVKGRAADGLLSLRGMVGQS